MPANFGGARRIRRRRTTFRRKSVAKVVPKATKTYVKKALKANKETNYALIENGATSISYDVPTLTHWSAVAQGDTIRTRDGDRIEPTSLRMAYQCVHDAVTVISRIIVFQWKPDNQVDAPSMAKILEVPSTNQSVYSPYMQDKVDRSKFVVLYDKIHTGDATGLTATTHTRTVNIRKFANKFINYNEAATTGKSQIYVLAFSNVAAVSTEPTFNRVVYLHWKDTA